MRTKTRANQRGFSVSKKWLRHVFRINTERLHIGAVSAPCKETLAAQGIPNLIHMSSGSVESLRGLRFRINPGFFDRLEPALTSTGSVCRKSGSATFFELTRSACTLARSAPRAKKPLLRKAFRT